MMELFKGLYYVSQYAKIHVVFFLFRFVLKVYLLAYYTVPREFSAGYGVDSGLKDYTRIRSSESTL